MSYGIMKYVITCDGLFSLSMFSRLNHVSVLTFLLWQNNIPLYHRPHFLYLPVDGHLLFLPLGYYDDVTINIHVHVFMWTYVIISLRDIPRSEITGS